MNPSDVNIYGARIPWEIPVQLCLSDFLRPGDIAFDVGANIGGVAIALSRIVGPEGQVHAFEANPQACAWLERDLKANGITNTTVICKGIWKNSGESLPFFVDESYYAGASGFHRTDRGWRSIPVETLSLDEYSDATGVIPRAVKIDVERAEYEVLLGMRDLIRRRRPALAFEYFPGTSPERDPVELVRGLGYLTYDTNLYAQVSRRFYHERYSPVPLANVIAVPDTQSDPSYRHIEVVDERSISPTGCAATVSLTLERAGRYRIDADFDGPGTVTAALRILDEAGETLAYNQAPLAQLREPACSSLILEIPAPCRVKCLLECKTVPNLSLRSIRVLRIEGLPREAK